jgi:deazaflavin-dependent oxidoreductase (nitroreductase family)
LSSISGMRLLRNASVLIVAAAVGWLVFGQLTVTQPFVRFFYPNGRPNRVARLVVRSWSWVVATGLVPARWPGQSAYGSATIVVPGRRSGRPRTTVATWVERDGERYFVSMSGEGSDWVKNLRAAGGQAVLRRGAKRPVRLDEVPVDERAPIIQAWYHLTYLSTRSRLGLDRDAPLEEFERIALTHPVFRIVDATGDERSRM